MITNSWLRITAWAAGLVGVAAALHIVTILYEPVLRPVLRIVTPFAAAVALALLFDPTIDRIERRGVSRGLAVGLVAGLFILALAALGVFLVPVLINQAADLAGNLPGYYTSIESRLADFMADHESTLRRLRLPTTLQDLVARYSDQIKSGAARTFAGAADVLKSVASTSVWLIIIPIVTIFLLADIDRIKAKLLLVVPEKQRKRTAELSGSIGRVFGAYIRGLVAVAVLYGAACGVALWLWGVPYAVMLGAAAGALSLVPYIGTIATVLLVALVAFVHQPANPLQAVYVALTIIAVNQLFDNIVTPRMVGRAVGLHPALAILALLIGGSLFGIVGMILAVPVAASIQILVIELYPPLRGLEPERRSERPLLSRFFRRTRAEKPEKPRKGGRK